MPARFCPECGGELPPGLSEGTCPNCLLKLGLGTAPTASVNTAAASSLGEQSGSVIGRYKLVETIGEGGFGTVWLAEQQEPVRRLVALKIIKLGMDTREVIARFEAERQALALMDHPSIARVFDGGATDSGRPYFVMELVKGVRITDYCDAQRLSTEERLKLFITVCEAVQHAHQKGIIHRDLKPGNILVTEQDGRAVPKVIDFGIAKVTEAEPTGKTLFTRFNQLIGTPAYMSPEQAGLGGLDVDTRSDIYALGVLLYELLTGRTPFSNEVLLKAGLDPVLRIIRESDPPKPSTQLSTLSQADLQVIAQRRGSEPAKLNRLVRGDLDWIVMKCLEKDRSRRYETANGLAVDINRHLINEPVVARPPGNLYRLRKLVLRQKLAFTAASAVAIALLIGLGVSTWMFFKESAARQHAVAAEQNEVRWRLKAEAGEKQAQAEAKRALAAVQAARQSELEARSSLARLYVASGVRMMNDGDLMGSLLWLAKAMELEVEEPDRRSNHHRRFEAVLRQCPKLIRVCFQAGGADHFAFSPDGSQIVTASSQDNTAWIWDSANPEISGQPLKHGGSIMAVAFRADGNQIITSCKDGAASPDIS